MHNFDNKERYRRAEIVIEQGGILPYCEALYIHSILYTANQCQQAFSRYVDARSTALPPEDLIAAVQTAVGRAAVLSRYFWPSGTDGIYSDSDSRLRKLRGERLRTSFQVTDRSPLCNRDLRNAWEHFDEKLDRFLLATTAGVFLPSGILGNHSLADDPLGHVFKLLDTEAECLVLLNKKYFFGALRAEVDRITAMATESDRNGARLASANIGNLSTLPPAQS